MRLQEENQPKQSDIEIAISRVQTDATAFSLSNHSCHRLTVGVVVTNALEV